MRHAFQAMRNCLPAGRAYRAESRRHARRATIPHVKQSRVCPEKAAPNERVQPTPLAVLFHIENCRWRRG